jgi:hypothetical protein
MRDPQPIRPDAKHIGRDRQRLQGRFVQLLEQLPSAGSEMARDLVVEPLQKRANGRVHVLEAE